MADERIVQATKLVDPTTTSQQMAVDASGHAQIDIAAASVNVTVVGTGTFVVQEDGAALTALQLIDNPVQVLGTDTYLEGTDSAFMIGVVRNDALATLASLDNEIAPLQVNASGALYIQEGSALTVASHAVTNAGTFVVQEDGAALTALQLIDDIVYTDDTDTHATGTSKGAGIMAAAVPTDAAVAANDIGMLAMSLDRRLHTDTDITASVNLTVTDDGSFTLAANSGIDIGDVDVLSVIPGTAATNLGKAESSTHTTADVGVLSLAVRDDTPVGLAADGEYIPLTTDSVGRLHVTDPNAGAGSPTGPTTDVATSAAVAAGSSADLNSAEITEAEKLWGVDLTASVPFKGIIRMVENAADNPNHVVVFGQAGELVQWRPANKDFFTHAGASGGLDVFQADVTNLDTSEAADLYCTFTYST